MFSKHRLYACHTPSKGLFQHDPLLKELRTCSLVYYRENTNCLEKQDKFCQFSSLCTLQVVFRKNTKLKKVQIENRESV